MAIPKVLLITPDFQIPGGVSEFNKMLVQYSHQKITPFVVSSAGKNVSFIWSFVLLLGDLIRFTVQTSSSKHNIVHINPSLGKTSILRDSIFVWIAKKFGKKVFVHWHGWNPDNEYLLISHKNFLSKTMFKADHIKFLASSFQKQIQRAGFKNVSSLGNTFIDDRLLSYSSQKNKDHDTSNILFLSTISKNKGIYETLETYRILKEKYPDISLTIAGTGKELDAIKSLVNDKNISGVEFKGFVSGVEKSKTYIAADIYFFPSYYEGMPTSVIEAMGFGLPVVCSSVGALPDFFIDGKMGFLIEQKEPNEYSKAIEKIIKDKKLRTQIGLYNVSYSQQHFLASKTVAKIDLIYSDLTNNLL